MKKTTCTVLTLVLASALLLPGCGGRAGQLRDDGIAAFQVGRVEAARTLLADSLALRPDDPKALYYMGRVMHTGGHLPNAVAFYEAALNVSPGYADAEAWLARARDEVKRPPAGTRRP